MYGPMRRIPFALIGAAALTAGWQVALAQQGAATTASTADSTPELQEVVVTGSLIARPNAETAEAISIVSADDLRNQGVTTVGQARALVRPNQIRAYQTTSA